MENLLRNYVALEKSLHLSGLGQFSKSGFNTVKVHELNHHFFAIMLFENPLAYSTQVGERLNGRKIKNPYQRGNKKDNEKMVSILLLTRDQSSH